MKSVESLLGPEDSVRVVQYDPSKTQDLPPGCKARTSSRGAEVLIQRTDGIMFSAFPMDWIVQVNGGEPFVLHDPCFRELFKDA